MYTILAIDDIVDSNYKKDIEISSNKINDYLSEPKLQNKQIILNQETDIVIKKKKGRKSNKDKILELEALEKNKIPDKLFPSLSEKIFDVIKINDIEYFLDKDFSVIYDYNINLIGFKKNDDYILYSEFDINKIIEQLKSDNDEISQIFQS